MDFFDDAAKNTAEMEVMWANIRCRLDARIYADLHQVIGEFGYVDQFMIVNEVIGVPIEFDEPSLVGFIEVDQFNKTGRICLPLWSGAYLQFNYDL